MVRKRPRIEPTDDWQEILTLCWWPEQVEYERIRQPVLFGSSVPERAEETGVSERALQRRIQSFEEYGIEGFLSADTARHRELTPNVRRLIVDLKAEYPPFNLNEIANIVRACFGRKPDVRSVRRVLDEEALPLKLERNHPRYHEMDAYERRAAIVELRVDGWSVTATARPGSNQDDLKAVGEKDPSRLTTEEVDIVDPDSVDSLERALGDRRFDAIFQNAGVWGPMHQSVLEVTPEEATTRFVTNAMGPARIVRRLLHRLPETGGLIAFMTSQRGSVAENVEGGLELYRASKAALNSLTRSIWADIAPDGRTLLDIHPGWVQTDMGTLGGTVSAEIGLKESVTGVADVVEQRFGTPGHYYVDYQGKLIAW